MPNAGLSCGIFVWWSAVPASVRTYARADGGRWRGMVQAALAQLHVLQQLMAQHGPAGLPAQLTSVTQMPAGSVPCCHACIAAIVLCFMASSQPMGCFWVVTGFAAAA